MKSVAGDLAKAHKGLFKTAALVIIGTHVVATAIALCALQFRATFAHSLGWFLIPELVLIGLGFCIHIRLHRREASHRWATSRLLAELGRSVSALGGQHLHLDYLFQLPFPGTFSPLLRTLNVLHLASTVTDSVPWQLHRSRYLAGRLDGADKQIDFYSRQSAHASGWLKIAHRTFNACSGSAFIAAFCKLLHLGGAHGAEVTGPLAILLPVLAVAALSLAAAFDLEARKYTFADMVEFLLAQRKLINAATTEREFCQLLLETESRLLGEIVNWYSRRAFTGVA